MKGLIIEGVAGTGKSTLFEKLKTNEKILCQKNLKIIYVSEEDTLGELFSELSDKNTPHSDFVFRLEQILNRLKNENADFVIFERFHHSYYALGIKWDLLLDIDKKLSNFKFKTILLNVDVSLIESRCLKRQERESENWEENFLNYYGSAEKAVKAFKDSQELRQKSLSLSQLPYLVINTNEMKWNQYIDEIINFGFSV